ncbi:MAG: hypothetical protein LBI28_08745 [Treponema sp.]|nr:hypothetical protein [Treponema sp.]
MIDSCSKLNPYGVIVRYPNELSIDETVARNSVVMAQKIYEFCHLEIQK